MTNTLERIAPVNVALEAPKAGDQIDFGLIALLVAVAGASLALVVLAAKRFRGV